MHLDGRSRLRLGAASNRLSRWLAVLFPVTIVGSVCAQSSLTPPPGFQGASAVPSMGGVTSTPGQGNSQVTGQTLENIGNAANGEPANTQPAIAGTPAEATGAPVAAPVEALLHWGIVHVHPRASYQFLYAHGLHNQPGSSTDTFTHTLAPGLGIELGPHVTLDYTASIRFFSERDFHNTVDHALSLNAGYHIGDWTLGLAQTVVIADEPLVQTSSQTQRSDYNTALVASYSFNEKLSLTTTAGVDLQYTDGASVTNAFVGGTNGTPANLSDSRSYSGSESLNYKFSDELSGGATVSLSYTEQGGGFRSVEQQYTGHLGWHPGAKFSAMISGGFEHRNFLDSKASDVWNPICSASVGYQMFEQTSLSLYANRSVSASIFQNQLSEDTAVGVGLQQRLLGLVQVSLSFGYRTTDYKSTTTSNLSTSRSDDGLSYIAGATVPFLTRCSFSAFCQYNQFNSSQKGFGYNSTQVGATLNWSY